MPAGRALVLVAGLPGSGKSTLLAGLPDAPNVAVVDSQAQADRLGRTLPRHLPYRAYRPLVHVLHRLAVVGVAFAGPAVVVIHLPATGTRTRRAVALLARLSGRSAHLVWLDVDPEDALRGQRRRGRATPGGSFERKVRRAGRIGKALRAGQVPPGWSGSTVLERAHAATSLASVVARAAGRCAGSVDPAPGK